jgi:hypothetical protein
MSRTRTASLQGRILRFTLCVAAMVCVCYWPAAGQRDTGTTLKEIGADGKPLDATELNLQNA